MYLEKKDHEKGIKLLEKAAFETNSMEAYFSLGILTAEADLKREYLKKAAELGIVAAIKPYSNLLWEEPHDPAAAYWAAQGNYGLFVKISKQCLYSVRSEDFFPHSKKLIYQIGKGYFWYFDSPERNSSDLKDFWTQCLAYYCQTVELHAGKSDFAVFTSLESDDPDQADGRSHWLQGVGSPRR